MVALLELQNAPKCMGWEFSSYGGDAEFSSYGTIVLEFCSSTKLSVIYVHILALCALNPSLPPSFPCIGHVRPFLPSA